MKKVFILLACLILIVGGYYIYKFNKMNRGDSVPPMWLLADLMTSKEIEVVSRCIYKNEVVYYIPSPCCDQYNYLYNKVGEKICAPNGGITGGGDGNCSDFSLSKSNCQIIWLEDSRAK